MTMPDQRTRVLIEAREFLREIAGALPPRPRIADATTDIEGVGEVETIELWVSALRKAERILRHYPTDYDIDRLAESRPDILSNTK